VRNTRPFPITIQPLAHSRELLVRTGGEIQSIVARLPDAQRCRLALVEEIQTEATASLTVIGMPAASFIPEDAD